jgi:hypothetical protein
MCEEYLDKVRAEYQSAFVVRILSASIVQTKGGGEVLL